MNIAVIYSRLWGWLFWFNKKLVRGENKALLSDKKYGFYLWTKRSHSGRHVKVQLNLHWGTREKSFTNYAQVDYREELRPDKGHKLMEKTVHVNGSRYSLTSGRVVKLDFADEELGSSRVWIVSLAHEPEGNPHLWTPKIPMYGHDLDPVDVYAWIARSLTLDGSSYQELWSSIGAPKKYYRTVHIQ